MGKFATLKCKSKCVMKKLLLVLVVWTMALGSVWAQQRTKIAEGVTLVRYGNTAVVEDDINQTTWRLSVERDKNKAGEWVYNIACGNKYTKAVAKFAVSSAIRALLIQTGVGSTVSGAAATIAVFFYDDVCDYFGERI